MPRTRTKSTKSANAAQPGTTPSPLTRPDDVLTLAEAAAYLRLLEPAVVQLVNTQGLPGRKIGEEWRFLKAAIQDWLRTAPAPRKDFWDTQVGAFKDDPLLDEMLQEIYRQRGRPVTEDE